MTDSAGFTAIPNWLIDDVLPYVSSNAAKVLLVIARKTIGWNKHADRIAFSQLVSLTGLNRTPLTNAIRELVERGVIDRQPCKNSYTYRIAEQSRNQTDVHHIHQSRYRTVPHKISPETRPKTVWFLDTQKKKERIHDDVYADADVRVDSVAADAATAASLLTQPEKSHVSGESGESGEFTQPHLISMPEHPSPPVPPAPPSPASPARPRRERKPPAPAAVRALYEPAFALTQVAVRGEAAIAVRNACRDLWRDYQATPDEVAGFGAWFARHSPAARIAAQQRRQVSAPMPRQLYGLWPQYRAYLDGRARAAAARRMDVRDPEPATDDAQTAPAARPTREYLQSLYDSARRRTT